MVSFFVALWIATILSIYKSWRRTAWGEQQYAQRKAKAQGKFARAIAE